MSWWHRLWHRARLEAQLDKELRFHLDQHTNDLIAGGLDAAEARRQARLALGGPEQVKETCRDARGTRWLEDLWQDFRYALRTLRQRPGFTAVALCTLGLGIGATTVMFTVINGVLLKPLPYPEPARLVQLQEQTNWSNQWGNLWSFAYPNYVDCKREVRTLDMAAMRYGGGVLSAPGDAEYVDGMEVSSDLFSVLGVGVFRGRSFLAGEDQPGGPPVAMISHGLWQRRFGGSAAAIGMSLVYDGQRRTVVGVTPAGFRLDGLEVDLLTPIGQDPSPMMLNRERHGTVVWARLRSGATLAQANSQLAVIGRQLEAGYPQSNRGRTFIAEPLHPRVGNAPSTLWLLLGAVGMVLLVACANIASLLVARAISREREFAMRAALGAGPGRLARQSLTESAVLGLAGGALGVALAVLGVQPFIAFWPGSLPRADEVRMDGRAMVFALGISLAASLLFGLAPALRARARTIERTLRAGARTITGDSRRTHSAFVAAEIALCVVLLVSAGMLGRTLLRLSSLDPGVNVRDLLTARVALAPGTLADAARTRAAWRDILDRARRTPGVESIAMVDTVPMREGSNAIPYTTSAAAPPDDQQPLVLANSTTPDYLKVTGIPLRRGRFLTDQDRMGAASVAVVDEVMAQQAFPGQDPIGRHLWIGIAPDPVTVVGIVGHVRQWGLAGDDQARVRAQLYYPFAQVPDKYVRRWSELMSIAVRTSAAPRGVLESLRREVRGATNDQVLYQVRTMEQLAGNSLGRQRFLLLLFGIFAGLALLLASIGIYGVLAYLTGRRVPEIGIRMALGASAGDVQWMVLRQSAGMIAAGVGIGTMAALAAARILAREVEGVGPTQPTTYAIMVAILVVAALLASYLPARRASRVDPISALRQE